MASMPRSLPLNLLWGVNQLTRLALCLEIPSPVSMTCHLRLTQIPRPLKTRVTHSEEKAQKAIAQGES